MKLSELKKRLATEEFGESNEYNQHAIAFLLGWDGVNPLEFEGRNDLNPDHVLDILRTLKLRYRLCNNSRNYLHIIVKL